MNDRRVIVAIKDLLQDELEDPRQQYNTKDRSWVHTDIPLQSASYPRIQVRRARPSESDIIDIGEQFWEHRWIVLNIQLWSAPPFKWYDTGSETYLKDEEFIKEYMDKIWRVLKKKQSYLKSTYGITGLKYISEVDPYQQANSHLYTGVLTVRFWYFYKNKPPIVDAGEDVSISSGDTYTLTATASDPNFHTLSYSWVVTGPGAYEHTSSSASISDTLTDIGEYIATVTVTDEDELSTTDSLIIIVS